MLQNYENICLRTQFFFKQVENLQTKKVRVAFFFKNQIEI